jgi:hypothetical protein
MFGTIKTSTETLHQWMLDGAERNIVIFDHHANGNITARLIYLMLGYSEDQLRHIWIPTDSFPEFDYTKKLYGITFIRDKRLNIDGPIVKGYIDKGCSFPHAREGLVIGIERTGRVLLGAI